MSFLSFSSHAEAAAKPSCCFVCNMHQVDFSPSALLADTFVNALAICTSADMAQDHCHCPPCCIFCCLPLLPHYSKLHPPPPWYPNGFITRQLQILLSHHLVTFNILLYYLKADVNPHYISLLLLLAKSCVPFFCCPHAFH